MKIDEKTLSILGAPKEGFEWVEMPYTIQKLQVGDNFIGSDGRAYGYVKDCDDFCLGLATGTGKFYRQVPIEPEPEVIWTHSGATGLPFRILADGSCEYCFAGGKWVKQTQTDTEFIDMVKHLATQNKELKALKEKLGEIKKQASILDPGPHERMGFLGAAKLIRLATALEVE